MIHLPPFRFHCVGGCWDRTQDSCDCGIGCQTYSNSTYVKSELLEHFFCPGVPVELVQSIWRSGNYSSENYSTGKPEFTTTYSAIRNSLLRIKALMPTMFLKGTVSRDFRLQVFLLTEGFSFLFCWATIGQQYTFIAWFFIWIFCYIWYCCQCGPQVSLTPTANLPPAWFWHKWQINAAAGDTVDNFSGYQC